MRKLFIKRKIQNLPDCSIITVWLTLDENDNVYNRQESFHSSTAIMWVAWHADIRRVLKKKYNHVNVVTEHFREQFYVYQLTPIARLIRYNFEPLKEMLAEVNDFIFMQVHINLQKSEDHSNKS